MTDPISSVSPKSSSRAWLWLLVLPAAGFATFVAALITLLVMTTNIEKSPGYALASSTITRHAGVESLLGGPVRVKGTKSTHIKKTPTSTTLELTFELSGTSGQGIADVIATEKGGRWQVQRATVASARGRYGLLADGGLQPLYDPKGPLASGS